MAADHGKHLLLVWRGPGMTLSMPVSSPAALLFLSSIPLGRLTLPVCKKKKIPVKLSQGLVHAGLKQNPVLGLPFPSDLTPVNCYYFFLTICFSLC